MLIIGIIFKFLTTRSFHVLTLRINIMKNFEIEYFKILIFSAEKIKIFEQIEKLYTIYLLKTDLPKDLDEYLFHKIILHTYWHEVQCLFESVKEKMLADDDKVELEMKIF